MLLPACRVSLYGKVRTGACSLDDLTKSLISIIVNGFLNNFWLHLQLWPQVTRSSSYLHELAMRPVS
jgi:hypothetical protein